MAQPPDISNATQAALRDLGLASQTTTQTPKKELGQAEFFDLMVAQLKFQDPLKPVANTEFVSQMAQFSSLNNLEAMSTALGDLVNSFQSSQALQASTLVGRKALVPSQIAVRDAEETVSGAVELPASSGSVAVSIFDASGALVNRLELGAQAEGRIGFAWDGSNANGEPMPAGTYLIQADAQIGDSRQALESLVQTRIDSVSLSQSPSGVTLNLAGLGAVGLSAVRELL